MRSFALATLTMALLAWPGTAAARGPCTTEFDGCAARFKTTPPIAALKCVDGFQACARECAAVNLCRGECWSRNSASARRASERFAAWFDLGVPSRAPHGTRR